jgi:hypothetical protein
MVLRYVTINDFINGQTGIEVTVGPDQCFGSDEELINYLEAIEQQVDNYLGRKLNIETHMSSFWGTDRSTYFTRNYPIRSVSSISYTYVGNTNIPEIVDTTQYFVSKYSVTYPSSFSIDKYYTIVYEAGMEVIPQVVKQAIIEQAALNLQELDRGVLESESFINTKKVYVETPLPLFPMIQRKLSPYKSRNMFSL